MRKHLINSVTPRNTHDHRFTRTFSHAKHILLNAYTTTGHKNITSHTHTHAQSEEHAHETGRVRETQRNREGKKETSGGEGALVRQGREIPRNFEFPHSRCVCISELWKSRRRKSQSRLGTRARTREKRRRDHRSLELIAFAMDRLCKWWEWTS